MDEVGVVVDGFLTELITTVRLVPALIIVLISTRILEELLKVQVEAIPVIEQVIEDIVIVFGNTI